MKYIDAERLYKQVDELMARFAKLEKEAEPDTEDLSIFYQGKKEMCSELLGIIDSLQQEQPDVDFEKEINKYFEPIKPWQIQEAPYTSMENCARHFYELGFNARKKEEL